MREVIDESVEEILVRGSISSEHLVDLIRAFLVDSPGHVELVLKSVRRQDHANVEMGALALKDAASDLGTLELHATCQRLQAAAHRRDAGAVTELGPTFRLDFEEAFGVLECLLETYG